MQESIRYERHFGVYALILSPCRTKMFLVHKTRGPYAGLYDSPGGTPEKDESITDTLSREILEETCGTLEAHGRFMVTTRRITWNDPQTISAGSSPGKHVLFHTMAIALAQVRGLNTVAQSEDTNGGRWLPIARAREAAVGSPVVMAALEIHAEAVAWLPRWAHPCEMGSHVRPSRAKEPISAGQLRVARMMVTQPIPRRLSGKITDMARSEKKADTFGQFAQEAWDAGAMVFTPKIHYKMFGVTGRGDDVARTIESILAIGWRLQGWAVVPDRKNPNPMATPLFVRP